jgi:integrase/recombinase XerD
MITGRYHPDLDSLLNEWLEVHRPSYTRNDSPYLFISQKSDQLSPTHINRIVKKAAERAGIQEELYADNKGHPRYKITSHALRHSFAVHFLRPPNPGSYEQLKEILGHEDIKTTQVYGEILDEDVDKAYQRNTTSLDDDPDGKHQLQECEKCGKRRSNIESHHISYRPERIMEVCQTCHLEIHDKPDEYEHLLPNVKRKEAERKGWI